MEMKYIFEIIVDLNRVQKFGVRAVLSVTQKRGMWWHAHVAGDTL